MRSSTWFMDQLNSEICSVECSTRKCFVSLLSLRTLCRKTVKLLTFSAFCNAASGWTSLATVDAIRSVSCRAVMHSWQEIQEKLAEDSSSTVLSIKVLPVASRPCKTNAGGLGKLFF
jgi:hypothetical protein